MTGSDDTNQSRFTLQYRHFRYRHLRSRKTVVRTTNMTERREKSAFPLHSQFRFRVHTMVSAPSLRLWVPAVLHTIRRVFVMFGVSWLTYSPLLILGLATNPICGLRRPFRFIPILFNGVRRFNNEWEHDPQDVSESRNKLGPSRLLLHPSVLFA